MKIQKLSFIFCCFIICTGGCAIDTGGSADNNNCPACITDDASVNNNNTDPNDDRDDDGFTEDQGDCDDENPVIYPNAPEVCDGHDNDCDGVVDEGCNGCESGDTRACGSDEGVCVEGVQVCVNDVWGDQCQGGVGPVPEVCGDGLDNDCDGLTDESCNEPTDSDGDGYTTQVDCDDSNPNVNPGASEVCGNGLDDDCDGQVDEGCSSTTDADGDGYTAQVDCDDSNASIHPNAPEVCNGLDDNCDGVVDEGCGGPICPSLTIERHGDQIWLSGDRATDFHVMEFWTNDNRLNIWVPGIQSSNLVIFPIPSEQGYDWLMPRTGYSQANPGAVLLVPDSCVQFVDVYSCSIDGTGLVGCPSLLECSQGGNNCPAPQ